LYAVTDRSWLGKQTLYEQVEEALKGGATFVQLREKELDDDTFLAEAIEIQELCKRYNVPFVINDNVEIARKNPNTVVVLYHGSVIDMSAWADKVAAIISVGYPGERGNAALAKIICGKVNPSGKTTETYPVAAEDCLAMHCIRSTEHSLYSDGLLVGYRWYDTAKHLGKENEARVLYPFGYGLSYSTFEYSDLKLNVSEENITVEFDVKNTSDIDGKECAEVYYRDPVSSVFRPFKELCGFEKKLIKAGDTEHYTVKVPKEYL
jgi:beta-glucosidase